MSENGLNVIDLVLTHLNQPWGPPWTLETLGDPWRPLATMPQNGQNYQNDLWLSIQDEKNVIFIWFQKLLLFPQYIFFLFSTPSSQKYWLNGTHATLSIHPEWVTAACANAALMTRSFHRSIVPSRVKVHIFQLDCSALNAEFDNDAFFRSICKSNVVVGES